jgi:translation initiation factor IF-1
VSENEVEWAADDGDDITTIEPDTTGVFFIRDDALDSTKTGTAVFSGIPANSKFFDIPNGAAGASAPGTTIGVTRLLAAPGYDTTTPANTPFTGRDDITVNVGGSSLFVVGSNNDAGTVTVISGISATTTVTFRYGHVVDVWDGQQTATRRARVTSTSDSAGEWITISEVNTVADSTPDSTSKLFRGQVVLSSNAATQGTSQDGVWIRTGDIVTVSYVNANGDVIDLDTVVVPGPTPTPTPIPTPGGIIPTPVPGTVTVAENRVEWASSNGGDMTAIEQDSTGIFLIRDDALETIKSGTAIFGNVATNLSTVFSIATGLAGVGAATGTTAPYTLTATGYNTNSPASTPLTDRADIVVTVGGSSIFVTGANTTAGEFTLISGVSAGASATSTFKYHTQDVWPGTDSALRRAKVTSTSDPAGEWVTVSEVVSATDSSPNPTSRLFRGEVVLSSNAATQGTAQDGVWVQVGDIVVVTYVDANGDVVDNDTAAVPAPTPTPTPTFPPTPTSTPTPAPTPTAIPTPDPSAIPTPVPGTIAVAENDVEWAAANGNDITTIEQDSTGIFLIRDDALETTKSGTAVFSGIPGGSKVFNIATGKAGPISASDAITRVLTAPGYSTNSPASTPLTDRADIVVTVGGSSIFVISANNSAGEFAIIAGVSATTTATFKYHVADMWSGTDTTLRRAKVTSSSDSAGEWVTISEVVSATDSSSSPTSRLFRGEVTLSSNAATQGTAQDGVWIQAGDAVVVSYVDSGGFTIDIDTLAVVLP